MQTWQLFNQTVAEHRTDTKEALRPLFVQMLTDLLGYSESLGEIDTHRTLHSGSADRPISDIILRDAEAETDLFIISPKSLGTPCSPVYLKQLVNSMRALSVKVGLLICDHLYIVYDDSASLFTKIPYDETSEVGAHFMELFAKGHFNADRVKRLIEQEQAFAQNTKILFDELLDLDIKALVATHYADRFTNREIQAALAKVDFLVRDRAARSDEANS